jgi:hypothetical protein
MSEKLNTISHQFIHSNTKKILDVCAPMDPVVFKMVVRILAPNALQKAKGQRTTIRKHMDLEFNICH